VISRSIGLKQIPISQHHTSSSPVDRGVGLVIVESQDHKKARKSIHGVDEHQHSHRNTKPSSVEPSVYGRHQWCQSRQELEPATNLINDGLSNTKTIAKWLHSLSF
jgi:hypothetical protein